jgi:hypothetical protein
LKFSKFFLTRQKTISPQISRYSSTTWNLDFQFTFGGQFTPTTDDLDNKHKQQHQTCKKISNYLHFLPKFELKQQHIVVEKSTSD